VPLMLTCFPSLGENAEIQLLFLHKNQQKRQTICFASYLLMFMSKLTLGLLI